MSIFLQVILLFAVGIISGFINVMAGGGSTLTLPVLIFLGLDSAVANGTNRLAILAQNLFAVYSFKREKYEKFKLSLKISLFTLPGAIAGALLAIYISDNLFNEILAVIMIGIVVSMVIPKPKKKFKENNEGNISGWVYLSMLFIGFYGGFIQVGVGLIIMAALHYLMKINLVHVNMHKVFIVFIYTIPAIFIFLFSGKLNWELGLALAAGNALGGWWAAKFSVKKGEGIIKIIMVVTVLIMSLKLLNLF